MKLTREVRFSLVPVESDLPVTNSWGGWPASVGLAPYLVLRVTVAGPVDPTTGYLCNISFVDQAARDVAIPAIRRRWLEEVAGVRCERLVVDLVGPLDDALPEGVAVDRLELRTTPYLAYAVSAGEPNMVSITQSFEFAAAHRLYCPDLPDEVNRRTFGKCASPNGHGHNYTIEVTLEGRPDPATGMVVALSEIERVVKARVVDVFDHKHLNEDCKEFADLNPSVENITRVIWDKLQGQWGAGARLACVRVFETPKTCAEYRGE